MFLTGWDENNVVKKFIGFWLVVETTSPEIFYDSITDAVDAFQVRLTREIPSFDVRCISIICFFMLCLSIIFLACIIIIILYIEQRLENAVLKCI